MDEFTTLFIMEENISWNGFLFSIMAFLFILTVTLFTPVVNVLR